MIVNIAEKPSVANSISKIFSTNCRKSKGLNKYCSNIYFEIEYNLRKTEMVFTSVLGHLMENKFENQDTNWKNSDPRILFDTRIINIVNPEHKTVAENIKRLVEKAEMVIIWTDCDREGENIASQIENTIKYKNSKIIIKRARFSAISKNEIYHALNNLVDINYKEADAVEARKELDLRIGSVFTRLQTVAYGKNNILSFGPCQIPTLNFVVKRHKEILDFIPEKFYSLENIIVEKNIKNSFKWTRGNIFDKNCVIHFYNELCNGKAIIVSKNISNKEKFRPLPLRTVEFQKTCSSYYKISGQRIMEIAEKLYNNGYISYPRTETDSFPKNFGFNSIINKLKNDEKLGSYASNFKFKMPRSGNNNDQAHSPIYPLKSGSELMGDERKIYEFVSRRFLGCISDNAKGLETEYRMTIGMKSMNNNKPRLEEFICKGLNIIERNYLDIYIYDKWESNPVSDFEVQQVVENNLEIQEGSTTKPEYLTESDLITLMDKNGIGTDATIHEHIQKIQDRKYAKKINYRFRPLDLGSNLINAYNLIELPISEPTLRKNLEENLKKVCLGEKQKDELVVSEIESYKNIYDKFVANIDLFKDIMYSTIIEDFQEPDNDEKPKNKTSCKENKKNISEKRKLENIDSNHQNIIQNSANSKKIKVETKNLETKFLERNITKNNINNLARKENNDNSITCDCGVIAKLIESKKRWIYGQVFLFLPLLS